ncbi:MAG: endolytic transglycosylase MltG [Rikenellaceae bacterium]|nr:endolytic transglycosylase MltG [Rikenellaceae bacterium]
MLKKICLYIFLGGIIIGAITAIVGVIQFKGNAVGAEHDLYVSSRTDYTEVLDSLLPHIKHHAAFRFYARHIGLEKSYKAGHYRLHPDMNVIEIARMLKMGWQTPVRVTINNVRMPSQLAAKLARQIDADSIAIMRALTSKELAKEMGFDSLTLFSMFIPNSYEFYWTVSPEDFVRRMKQEYDRFWTPERDKARQRSGLSRLEVMTLASIVYEETRKSDEMPRVAGVYINRLRKGMPLQADPTIKYAMQDFSLRRILYKHLKFQSPYNTYINKGLPPSPICMPGRNAIEAVLNFEQHDYIFFCARPTFDGYHNFARTLKEHNANARAYSAELNRRKIK